MQTKDTSKKKKVTDRREEEREGAISNGRKRCELGGPVLGCDVIAARDHLATVDEKGW